MRIIHIFAIDVCEKVHPVLPEYEKKKGKTPAAKLLHNGVFH